MRHGHGHGHAAVAAVQGEFSPLSFGGCVLWLRADRGITLNSGDVSAWADQSSSALDFTQGTAADQPLYVASQASLGNQPALDFDGANHWLRDLDASVVGSLTDCTWFWAADYDSAAGNQMILRGNGSNGIIYSSNPSAQYGYFDGTAHRSDTASATGAQYVTLTLDSSGTPAGQFRKNGSDLGASLGYDGTIDFSGAATMSIGASTDGGSSWFNGKLAELILFNSVLSTADRDAVESYLSARYGL